MSDQPARSTLLGKASSIALMVGLIGFGSYLAIKWISRGRVFQSGASSSGNLERESPNAADPAAIKEYAYLPTDRLPVVEGVSQYHWDEKERILRFSYNVWPGWLPVIAANHGTRPNAESIFYKRHGFRVDMVLMDDPVAARNAYAAGEVHTLWGTVDMMVLLVPELMKDSRSAPRIVQQMDWSSGGDGMVVRNSIKSAGDLKNKTVALAQNSRSEYYLTTLLLSAGLRPSDLKMRYTATAFEAAAAFVVEKRIDACVSWAPDIYKIPERVAGTRVLSMTSAAHKLIADVYAVRADFARDHPDIVGGLIAGIFEGMDAVKQNPEEAARWMADAFGRKPEDAIAIRNDAHPANFAENVQFFLNASNPTNFERTWNNASSVFREIRRIDAAIPFDQVMDFSFLKRIQKSGVFARR